MVVVGYGFGDKDINDIIADAGNNPSLRLCVVTPKSAQQFHDEIYPVHGQVMPKPRGLEILQDKDFLHFFNRVIDFYNSAGQLTTQGQRFFDKVGL